MWLLFEPLDVWMFRDGRPFSAGTSHAATSIFPPPAFVLQGALRTLYLEKTGIDWNNSPSKEQIEAVGWDKTLGNFRMAGPYVARWNADRSHVERFFPLPADVVQRGRDLVVLKPGEHQLSAVNSDLTDALTGLDLDPEKDDAPEKRYWIPESVLVARYLENQYPDKIHFLPKIERVGDLEDASFCIPESALFQREHRYGTALTRTSRTVNSDEGLLYSANFVRLCDGVGVLVWLPDDSPLAEIFVATGDTEQIRFGGEGRGARISRLSDEQVRTTLDPTTHQRDGINKIVFLTATWFASGSVPADSQIALLAAALPRPLALGGWDLKNNVPRPILRFVPAGSVYYINGTPPIRWTDQPPAESFAETLPLKALGFGEFVFANPD
jgi:CRISPR-associated protein Cmr3